VTAKQPRVGRPVLPPGSGKTRLLTVKVTPSEMALFDEVAARHKLDRSELVRRAVLAVAANPELLTKSMLGLRRDYTAVGRKTFLVEQLPDGALPIDDKDPEATAFVVGDVSVTVGQPAEKLSPKDDTSECPDGAVSVTFGGVTYRGFIDVSPRDR
jgi:hypothetical protein